MWLRKGAILGAPFAGDKRFRAVTESRSLLDWASHALLTPSQGEGRYLMENVDNWGKVSIRRYSSSAECDVIVAIRDREMVVRLPDYRQAVKWAQMESKAYKLQTMFSEE